MLRYAGLKVYMYLSYTSADCYDIFGLIELLENRYRFWFGSDIEEGEKLPDDVRERIENCHVFLFFATECSVLSQQCREEIAFALERGKDIIVVLYEDAELTDTVIYFNDSIPQRVRGEEPLVVVAAVAFVYDAAVVCLDDAVVFECGTAGYDVCFRALGQLHGDAQRDELEFAGFQFDTFCCSHVDPVRFAVDVAQFFDFIA